MRSRVPNIESESMVLPARRDVLFWVSSFLAIVAVILALRLPALGIPLSRDEAAYAYIGHNLPNGVIPYRDVFDHKGPLVYLAYAGILTLFQTPPEVRLAFSLLFLLDIVLVMAIGKLIGGRTVALIAAMLFGVAGSSYFVQGMDGNTEHLMLPLALGCIYLLLLAERRQIAWPWALSGLTAAFAVMTKPVGLSLVAAAGVFILLRHGFSGVAVRSGLRYAVGFAIGTGVVVSAFGVAGALPQFWQQVFAYNLGRYGWFHGMPEEFASSTGALLRWLVNVPLPVALLAPLAMVGAVSYRRLSLPWAVHLLVPWAVFDFLAAKYGIHYFPHYYYPLIAPLSLLAAVTLAGIFHEARTAWPRLTTSQLLAILALVGLCLFYAWRLLPWYRHYSPAEAFLAMYSRESEVALDAPELVAAIQSYSDPDDKIFIWGAEPELYWLAERRATTRFIYHYPARDNPVLLRELLADLEESPPVLVLIDEAEPAAEMREFVQHFGYLSQGMLGRMHFYRRTAAP